MTTFDESVAAAGAMWGAADYDRLAQRFAPIHEKLVDRLGVERGARWLDVATGTGALALRAARAGAYVTGVDISEPLLEQARAKARTEGLEISFDIGDAQRLPYGDGEFDVVASTLGVMFAPDHAAAARELARVCRSGGRLGLTAWRRSDELKQLWQRYMDEEPLRADADAWGDEAHVRELLGDAFDLEFEEGEWALEAESPEAAWEFVSAAAPPVKALVAKLDDEQRKALARDALAYYERRRTPNGGVRETRAYLLVTGTRR